MLSSRQKFCSAKTVFSYATTQLQPEYDANGLWNIMAGKGFDQRRTFSIFVGPSNGIGYILGSLDAANRGHGRGKGDGPVKMYNMAKALHRTHRADTG